MRPASSICRMASRYTASKDESSEGGGDGRGVDSVRAFFAVCFSSASLPLSFTPAEAAAPESGAGGSILRVRNLTAPTLLCGRVFGAGCSLPLLFGTHSS
eukprot:GHVO01018608.1.p1 GENE.GHVO01018608.1~~GHVO01018608.1.p1  ORF type:complete len:100 (-),score=16.15 GHVO01018608.1:291-590(-)